MTNSMLNVPEKRVIGKHACERCRKAKTRCLTDTLEQFGKCRKCHALGVECEWKAISTTRRRKRTDARVTDLERQIQSLENALGGLRSGFNEPNIVDSVYEGVHNSPGDRSVASGHKGTHEGIPSTDPAKDVTDSSISASRDTCASPKYTSEQHTAPQLTSSNSILTVMPALQNLTQQRRAELFDDFRNSLLPQYPVITMSEEDSFELMEQSYPLLTAAIVTAASSISEPQAFQILHANMLQHLCQKVLIEGSRSMEILQATLISAAWFCPPDALERLNFYQWTHVAGTMALELGLGGKTLWSANRRAVTALINDASPTNLQSFRTMFGVYLTCSRVAISFRRQKMISYSPSTATALQIFAEHALTANDKRLVAWMKLQGIAEDVENMKSNVELRADSTLTERESVKSDLSLFNDRLGEWAVQNELLLDGGALKIDLAFCRAKLHELALYVDHDMEHLSLPSLFQKRPTSNMESTQAALNATYVRAVLSLVADCHSILDATLETPVDILRCCPILTFFRIAYAFRALAMLRSRASDPNNSVSVIIDDESLKWEYYVKMTGVHMDAASANGIYLVPAMTLRIRDTFRKQYPSSVKEPKPLPAQESDAEFSLEPNSYCSSRQVPASTLQQFMDNTMTNISDSSAGFANVQDWYNPFLEFDFPMMDDLSAFDIGSILDNSS